MKLYQKSPELIAGISEHIERPLQEFLQSHLYYVILIYI
jgi:hypothetical protein